MLGCPCGCVIAIRGDDILMKNILSIVSVLTK